MLGSILDRTEAQILVSTRERSNCDYGSDWELDDYNADVDDASWVAGELGGTQSLALVAYADVAVVTGKASALNSMVKLGGSTGSSEDTDVMLLNDVDNFDLT